MKADLRLAWESVRPDDTARARMLKNILAAPALPEAPREAEAPIWKTALPAAACVAILAGAVFLSAPRGQDLAVSAPSAAPKAASETSCVTYHYHIEPESAAEGVLPMERSKGVTAQYVQALFEAENRMDSAACWAALTEEELAAYYREPERDVFRGTIESADLLEITFAGDGRTYYRKVARVRVESVLKGELEPGETVKLLLPVVGVKEGGQKMMHVSSSTTGIIENAEAGVQGIFALPPLTEDSREETGGDVLDYRDLADYELTSDRGTFFYRDEKLWFLDYEATPFGAEGRNSMEKATLDDAEAWLKTIIQGEK